MIKRETSAVKGMRLIDKFFARFIVVVALGLGGGYCLSLLYWTRNNKIAASCWKLFKLQAMMY